MKIWAGPSRRPSGINALTFGRAKITLKLSSESLKQPRVSANDKPGLAGRLAAENVHVAPRLGRLRLSPHVYNDEEDADRFVAAIRRAVAG